MINKFSKNKLILVTGHFGSGKTNISINLAMQLREKNENVTIIDLDIVNPYFRMADSLKKLELMGIKCIVPEFANSNLDIPSLPPQIYSVFQQENINDSYTIFDVGGDDVGATALGVYKNFFDKYEYDMYYVINKYRILTSNPIDTLSIMDEIEKKSRLKCSAIINNSNLGIETTVSDILQSFDYADEFCRIANLPLAFHSITDKLFTSEELNLLLSKSDIFHMENITKNIYGGIINE